MKEIAEIILEDSEMILRLVERVTHIDKGYAELSFYAQLLLVRKEAKETKIYVVHTMVRMKVVNVRPGIPYP